MSRLRSRLSVVCAAGAATAVAAVATSAAAGAATISATAPCYVNPAPTTPAPMTIVGSGFIPGDDVEVTGGTAGTVFETGTVDGNGNISVTATSPLLLTSGPVVVAEPIQVEDESGAGTIATTTVLTTNLAWTVSPNYAKPTRMRTYHFSGFGSGQTLYAHYLHRGRVTATAAFGTTTAPCGLLTTHRLLIPGGHPRFAKYTVQFDTSKQYSSATAPHIIGNLSFTPR